MPNRIPRACRAVMLAAMTQMPLMAAAHDAGHGPALGHVHMPVPCNPAAQRAFDLGLLYQHSFGHVTARAGFESALAADPTCAMASWGIALATLDNLFETPSAGDRAQAVAALRAAPAASEPWDGWLAALSDLVREDGAPWQQHLIAFAAAMERLAKARPQDDETQVFHALSLLMAAPSDDPVFAAHRQAAAILEPIWARQPEHPGAMHYLIHAYDTPDLAPQGLPAALRYATVASASAHAMHMPSHIFTRLGRWPDSIGANRRSAALARAADSVNDELHARDYLVYGLLQSGRTIAARQAWAEAAPVVPHLNPEHVAGPFAVAAMPARLALEPGDWQNAATLPLPGSDFPQVVAVTRYARAIGQIRSGRPAEAASEIMALSALAARLREMEQAAWAAQVEAQRDAAAALATIAAGDAEAGLDALQQAADAEDGQLKNVVEPGPLAPARELLGEALLAMGRNTEAEAAFEAVLRFNPNRFRALAGAAAAAKANGRRNVAVARYRLLLAIAARADAPRPELAEAARTLDEATR